MSSVIVTVVIGLAIFGLGIRYGRRQMAIEQARRRHPSRTRADVWREGR